MGAKPTYISKEDLQKAYQDLGSLNAVGEKFLVDSSTIKSKMIKYGLEFKPQIRYTCDNDFFSRDDEKSFYWAGFIAADGCVKDRKASHGYGGRIYELQIGLSKKDKEHLIKFKNDICAENPIHDFKIKGRVYKNKKYKDSFKSEITIVNKKICDDLERFNIVPRKSLIYKFPEWIKNHYLVNHFIRGYFDGDGCLFIYDNQLCFNLLGTEDCLTSIKDIFIKNNLYKSKYKNIRKIKNRKQKKQMN